MNKKNIVVLAFCFGMLFSTSVTSMAAETDFGETDVHVVVERNETSVNTGDLLSPVESVEEQLAGLSEEQIEIALEKLNDKGNDSCITPYADTTWNYLTDFTMYKQDTEYFCTPAVCKAAMQYLTGSSDNQYTIAAALGTTINGTPFANAKTYLNDNQKANPYVSLPSSTNQSIMASNFYSAINSYNAPALISVTFSSTNGWPYDASGHTLCIYGARSDKEYFAMADPYIQWVDEDAPMYYSKSARLIHTAISDRGNGYIY